MAKQVFIGVQCGACKVLLTSLAYSQDPQVEGAHKGWGVGTGVPSPPGKVSGRGYTPSTENFFDFSV